MKIIKKYEKLKSGAVNIELNKQIETSKDLKQFFKEIKIKQFQIKEKQLK